MKCQEIGGDRKADFVVKADTVPCEEFNSLVAADGALCSWVPVSAGQKLTVEGSVSGSTSEVQVDLILDGVLRNTFKELNKGAKTGRRSIKFANALYKDEPECLAAEMVVQDLSVDAYPTVMTANKDSVGMIELLISVLRDENEPRHGFTGKTFETANYWKDSFHTPSFTSVRPTQEIDFVQIKEQPSKNKLVNLRKNVKASRIGSEPWAVLKFFYRTKDAIINEPLIRANPKHEFKFAPPPMTIQAPAMPAAEAPTAPVVPRMVPTTEIQQAPTRAVSEVTTQVNPTPTPEPESVESIVQSQPVPKIEAKIEPSSPAVATFPKPYENNSPPPVKIKPKEFTPAPSIASTIASNASVPTSKEMKVVLAAPTSGTTANSATPTVNSPVMKRQRTPGTPTPDPARKKIRSECQEIETLIVLRQKILAEKRTKRIAAEQAAKNADTLRKAALLERLHELECEIEVEDDLILENEAELEATRMSYEGFAREDSVV